MNYLTHTGSPGRPRIFSRATEGIEALIVLILLASAVTIPVECKNYSNVGHAHFLQHYTPRQCPDSSFMEGFQQPRLLNTRPMPEPFRPDFAILNAGYRLAADVETVVDTCERENPMPMTITFFDDHSTCRVEVRKGRVSFDIFGRHWNVSCLVFRTCQTAVNRSSTYDC
jgi:hypothetical protein